MNLGITAELGGGKLHLGHELGVFYLMNCFIKPLANFVPIFMIILFPLPPNILNNLLKLKASSISMRRYSPLALKT